MLGVSESRITIEVPSGVELESLAQNLTLLVTEIEETIVRSEPEEQIITDVWVGIVLTLLVLSCAACMCACMLYHRFQIWKRRVLEARANDPANMEAAERESLPSYTIVSGLPSYDEALQQLKIVKEKQQKQMEASSGDWTPHTPPTPMAKLSVTDLFQLYMAAGAVANSQAAQTPTITEPIADNKS